MNPKEMANATLFERAKNETTNNMPDWPIDYTTFEMPCYDELLRRLNERDALRKENEELRKCVQEYADFGDTTWIEDDLGKTAKACLARLAKESEANE